MRLDNNFTLTTKNKHPLKKFIHIAIADDHPTLVTGLKYIVNSIKNCKVVIEAFNGKELIDQIETSTLKPDIVLLDISMPVMDGYAALSCIAKNWPEIRVIILSQHFNDFTVIKTMRAGACACIPKEADIKELQHAITEVMRKGYYHTEYIVNNILESTNTRQALAKITEKEIVFLKHCCSDLSYVDIAKLMGVSPRTIDNYRDSLFAKLDVSTRSALVMFTMKAGLVPTGVLN